MMENDKTINICNMDLPQYIWRNCYQIVVWENEKSTDNFPDYFGSGFVLRCGDKLIFVTADHVIHPADEKAGMRTKCEYRYALLNNCNSLKDLSTRITPIGNFLSFDYYNLNNFLKGEEELDVAMIPEIPDYAFAEVKYQDVSNLLTHQLKNGDDILVKDGLNKLFLTEKSFATPSQMHEYMVWGVVHNELNDIRWERTNALYCELKYVGKDNGVYKFMYPANNQLSDWKGLSGSPFFDTEGHLIGMLVKVNVNSRIVWVIPIHLIWEMIKQMIRIQQL